MTWINARIHYNQNDGLAAPVSASGYAVAQNDSLTPPTGQETQI
jgi:hypothetical protein